MEKTIALMLLLSACGGLESEPCNEFGEYPERGYWTWDQVPIGVDTRWLTAEWSAKTDGAIEQWNDWLGGDVLAARHGGLVVPIIDPNLSGGEARTVFDSSGRAQYAEIRLRHERESTKLVAHELGHVLGLRHSGDGIMDCHVGCVDCAPTEEELELLSRILPTAR